ncbi:hypothetical protein [Microcoleus sp. S36b_A4]|uniref:hypothetical protein n=1 Tax=Microcoleus sp. S36b_A4 TaxID=3055420 RepID=UPI002FCE70D8
MSLVQARKELCDRLPSPVLVESCNTLLLTSDLNSQPTQFLDRDEIFVRIIPT